MVKISKGLLEKEKRRLIALLKEYKDVFEIGRASCRERV